jgi:hypothetical protein
VSKPPLTSCACVVDALNARAAATAMLLPIIVFKIFIEFFYVRLCLLTDANWDVFTILS